MLAINTTAKHKPQTYLNPFVSKNFLHLEIILPVTLPTLNNFETLAILAIFTALTALKVRSIELNGRATRSITLCFI